MPNALVTGASGGIGAAISRALAARGTTVTLHYQSDQAAAERTLASLQGSGHVLLQADLSDAQAVARLWQEASSRTRIDALINNAGVFPNHPPLTSGYEEWTQAWRRTLGVNL